MFGERVLENPQAQPAVMWYWNPPFIEIEKRLNVAAHKHITSFQKRGGAQIRHFRVEIEKRSNEAAHKHNPSDMQNVQNY